jgi:ABC-type Co2+ transport system permease subunit
MAGATILALLVPRTTLMSASRPDDHRRLKPPDWKFFTGACLLTGALLIPHAGLIPVLKGFGIAAILLGVWTWMVQLVNR